ncbi:MAG: hypothetical protein AAF685_16725 [Cyanobacteria bacterium P01_C01_bin.89]
MGITQQDYEVLLTDYSNPGKAIELLKEHRPYLEMLPSMRRPLESILTIALPLVRVETQLLASSALSVIRDRQRNRWAEDEAATAVAQGLEGEQKRLPIQLPCDLALLMCDPEWQVKTGVEIFVIIHRPDEGFYGLLSRWRQTQVLLDREYQWIMPDQYRHVMSESAEQRYPLFLITPQSGEHIQRGLQGSKLPYVMVPVSTAVSDAAKGGENLVGELREEPGEDSREEGKIIELLAADTNGVGASDKREPDANSSEADLWDGNLNGEGGSPWDLPEADGNDVWD